MAQRREAANSIGREAFDITRALYEAAAARVVTKCYRENNAAVAGQLRAHSDARNRALRWPATNESHSEQREREREQSHDVNRAATAIVTARHGNLRWQRHRCDR